MIIRRLKRSDVVKGLLEVLAHLSRVADIPYETLERIMGAYEGKPSPYRILVAEEGGQIVGTATLIITWKLLRGGIKAGRISDVATHPDWEGRGIGSQLVGELIEIARSEGCYKITLNCSQANVGWYARFGFREHEVAMRLDLLIEGVGK